MKEKLRFGLLARRRSLDNKSKNNPHTYMLFNGFNGNMATDIIETRDITTVNCKQ